MPRPKSAQNADTHFVPACAVEMHVNIAQEPLYTEICRKNVADTHFVWACEVEMHVKVSQEPLYTEIYNEKLQS